ncbi:MAG: DUF3300 domain-containing protein [Gammaproteobacteria bacterium]
MKKKYCRGINMMLLLSVVLLDNSGCSRRDDAQTAESPDAAEVQRENTVEANAPRDVLNSIESLVAPIALYPDPLLAEVLIAATYPPEIALAARRLETGAAGEQASGERDLDASILRLARLSAIIIMLNEHPQWTAALGDTFLTEPETLLDAIQTLRRRALQAGFLKDTEAQKIVIKALASNVADERATTSGQENSVSGKVSKREIVMIMPAETRQIHVPLYASETVFTASLSEQPAESGLPDAEQQSINEDGTDVSDNFYPSYYASSQSGDRMNIVFGAATEVNGLLTWGEIEWSHEHGYAINHRYGKVVACNGVDDCWLRSEDKGYYFTAGKTVKNTDEAGSSMLDGGVLLNPWYHDPRHRRGLVYSEKVLGRLAYLRTPSLAGQHFWASSASLQDRGFDMILPESATEAEDSPPAGYISLDVRDSVLSGISAAENAEFKASGQRIRKHRDRPSAVEPQQNAVPVPEIRRDGRKTLAKQSLQAEITQDLQKQRRFRRSVWPSAFDSVRDNVRLTVGFSRRGSASRNAE